MSYCDRTDSGTRACPLKQGDDYENSLCILALTVSGWAAEVIQVRPPQLRRSRGATAAKLRQPRRRPKRRMHTSGAAPKYDGWAFSGLVDGYSTYNGINPP